MRPDETSLQCSKVSLLALWDLGCSTEHLSSVLCVRWEISLSSGLGILIPVVSESLEETVETGCNFLGLVVIFTA